jgi:hypothetical protein
MRDDLLDAQAAVCWAVANLPAYQAKIGSWLGANISVVLKETDAPASHNVIVAVEKEPLPRAFNVEAGAYLNVIRSALDILAVSLAQRHGITRIDRVYFPILKSEAEFRAGKYKGAELINGLPAPERNIIKSLEPYKGGNDSLWALHQLDIRRKHHRLVAVGHHPARLSVIQGGDDGFVALRNFTGYITSNDETILGLYAKSAPKPKLQYTPEIFIAESDPPIRKPVIAALDEFASLANSIINLFDN